MISCGVLSTSANPRSLEEVAHVLVVPEREGTDGALARAAGPAAAGSSGRSAVPTCHGLRSTSCQQAKTRRPAGVRRRRMAREGRRRLVEEHHPELAHRQVEGPWLDRRRSARPSRRSRTLVAPASAARRPGELEERAEMSIPTTSPSGATAPASAMVRAPPPQPTSHTRWPGRASTAVEQVRRDGVGQPLPASATPPPSRRRSTASAPLRWPPRQRYPAG